MQLFPRGNLPRPFNDQFFGFIRKYRCTPYLLPNVDTRGEYQARSARSARSAANRGFRGGRHVPYMSYLALFVVHIGVF